MIFKFGTPRYLLCFELLQTLYSTDVTLMKRFDFLGLKSTSW